MLDKDGREVMLLKFPVKQEQILYEMNLEKQWSFVIQDPVVVMAIVNVRAFILWH